jgi:hypothetical protein
MRAAIHSPDSDEPTIERIFGHARSPAIEQQLAAIAADEEAAETDPDIQRLISLVRATTATFGPRFSPVEENRIRIGMLIWVFAVQFLALAAAATSGAL